MVKLLFLYLIIIFSCGFLQAQQGRVTKVIDAETIYNILYKEKNVTFNIVNKQSTKDFPLEAYSFDVNLEGYRKAFDHFKKTYKK